jgi:hypothetical protein
VLISSQESELRRSPKIYQHENYEAKFGVPGTSDVVGRCHEYAGRDEQSIEAEGKVKDKEGPGCRAKREDKA